jgi:hypothetical protein
MTMQHLVQFSTGVASAEIAWRLVAEHGPSDVLLLTADTRVEDPDNWRFAHEVVNELRGVRWVILADGRTPMEVGRQEQLVPNNRLAVCSRILKRELLRRYVDQHCDPAVTVIYEGYDWTETDRISAARPHWAPFRLAAPLAERPYTDKPGLLGTFRERGIEPPRLYGQGFKHANCGGACVRGGHAQWELLLRVNEPLYRRWEADEQVIQSEIGNAHTILRDRATRPGRLPQTRPLSLLQFRERIESQPGMFDPDDWGACGCGFDSEPPRLVTHPDQEGTPT